VRRASLAIIVALVACSGTEQRTPVVEPAGSGARPVETEPVATPPAATAAPMKPVALVIDRDALAVIAGAGGAFASLVSDEDRAVLVEATRGDIDAAGRGDPSAGVGVAGNSHRLFDAGYLAKGRFDLVGVAYRIDRLPATPDACGDLRLVYRLAYDATMQGETVTSRLPMTVAVVLAGPPRAPTKDDPVGCRAAAAAWRVPAAATGTRLGEALAAGPLAGLLARDRVRQVLTNTQVTRWPAAVKPDLAGHAEYALRAFRRGATALVAAPADGTPDAPRLRKDRRARARLLAWLREPATLEALELGWAELPAELAAPRALSVSPRGWARRTNRPYRQLLAPADVAELADAGRATIGSAEALLRRLDDHTCSGCHQAQTIAGFHLLGEDGPEVAPGNALAVTISAPLAAEQRRREAMIDALAAGAPADLHRPSFERTGNPGGRGAHCGLGDPGFAAWTCDAPLTCQHTDAPADDAAVGECLPPADQRAVGDPCELGALTPSTDARKDRGPKAVPGGCVAGRCNTNRVGFPGGMCRAHCDALPAGGACGVIAVLTPFNNCLARGTPFPRCIADHVEPAGLRACDAATPCRDDYICARTPAGDGACTPPYFLFQLRVDGHPPSKLATSAR
jgi:hypothetical protein